MATITATALASAELNILVSALQFVDSEIPGSALVSTLDDPAADLTVFAPTDAAFGILAVDLGFTGDTADESAVTAFLATTLGADTLRDVVLYHVSAGAKTLAEVGALATVATLNGATIAPAGLTLGDNEPDLLDPTIATADIAADNGIVHLIDRVLLPSDLPGNDAPTIAGLVAASGSGTDADSTDLDILLAAVTATGLVPALDDAAADLTVFAPTDAAFEGLATALGFTGGSEAATLTYVLDAVELLGEGDLAGLLTTILTYHVAPGSLQSAQVLAAGTIPTLAGPEITVSGATLVDQDPDLADPGFVTLDLQAANGIVHVIDGVLIPADLLPTNGLNAVQFEIGSDRREILAGARDNDWLSGKAGRDILIGRDGGDVILGGAGSDLVSGGEGDDRLYGGAEHDLVLGGTGADLLEGGAGLDRLHGSTGNDDLRGGADADRLIAGTGADTLSGDEGNDRSWGGTGADIFVFAAGHGRDTVLDFRNGQDRIDLTDFGFADFAAVEAIAVQRNFGLSLNFDGGETLALRGLDLDSFDASDVIL